MATTTNLNTLVINQVDSEETYQAMSQQGKIQPNQLYLIPGLGDASFIYYGTSASAAADTTKIVSCTDFKELKAGSAILVKFSTTNSAAVADLQLNVNSTGAKSIKYINNGTLGNLSSAGYLKANTTYLFIYDGTYWVAYFNYNSNTTYSSMTAAEITAGTGTTARTITPANLKTAVQTWEHVHSVNGLTGDVVLDGDVTTDTVGSASG